MNTFRQTFLQAPKTRGFTLLEVLVVLVITSLISVVLIQGFALVLGARNSVQAKIVGLEQVVLKRNIFLEPLRGVLPDYPNQPNIFRGEEKEISGITVRSLQSRPGTPVSFVMTMSYDPQKDATNLTYQEEGFAPQVLGEWEGVEGAFRFRDRKGSWLDAWPPSPDVPQTPWLIRLDMGHAFPSSFVVNVRGPHQRVFRMKDLPSSTPIR
jgi:general secretion pathway protein J